MSETRLLCWNVNGIRAVRGKGFLEWLHKESPDILCLQETKAMPEQLDGELREPPGYYVYWNYPERKGYSGVATFARQEPQAVSYDFGADTIDLEGRVVATRYPGFTLLNIYFPNGKKDDIRLKYKLDFYDVFLRYADSLMSKGEKLVVCGDFNTAHREIDLSRPKENSTVSGFLPEEREWLDRFVANGFIDAFRHFHTEPDNYSWWDFKTRARERNVGWRIDYFFISQNLVPSLTSAFIMPDVMGSDHCPVGITLNLS